MIINFSNVQYWNIPDIDPLSVLSSSVQGYLNLSVYVINCISSEISTKIWQGSCVSYGYLYLSCNDTEHISRWISPDGLYQIDDHNYTYDANINTYVLLKLVPKDYYHVASWLCNNYLIAGNTNDVNIFVNTPKLSTSLSIDTNKISLSCASMTGGSISADHNIPGTYSFDEIIHISAIPAEGSAFYRWSRYDSDYDHCSVDLTTGTEYLSSSTLILSASFIRKPNFEDGTILNFSDCNQVKFIFYKSNNSGENIIVDFGFKGK